MIFGAATSVGRSTGTVLASRRSWMTEVCSRIKVDLPAHFDRLVSRALASNAGNGDQIARVPTKPGEETGEVPGKVDTGTFSNSGWVPCRVCSSATPTVSRGPRIEPRFSRWVFETSPTPTPVCTLTRTRTDHRPVGRTLACR